MELPRHVAPGRPPARQGHLLGLQPRQRLLPAPPQRLLRPPPLRLRRSLLHPFLSLLLLPLLLPLAGLRHAGAATGALLRCSGGSHLLPQQLHSRVQPPPIIVFFPRTVYIAIAPPWARSLDRVGPLPRSLAAVFSMAAVAVRLLLPLLLLRRRGCVLALLVAWRAKDTRVLLLVLPAILTRGSFPLLCSPLFPLAVLPYVLRPLLPILPAAWRGAIVSVLIPVPLVLLV